MARPMALPATHIRFAAALSKTLGVTEMAAYLDLVRRAYGRRTKPDWSDYTGLWRGVGLDRQRISRIKRYAQRLLAEASLVAELHATFYRMVNRWNPTAAARV